MIEAPRTIDGLEPWVRRRYARPAALTVDRGRRDPMADRLRQVAAQLAACAGTPGPGSTDVVLHVEGCPSPFDLRRDDMKVGLRLLGGGGVFVTYEHAYGTLRVFDASDLRYRLWLTPFLNACWTAFIYLVVVPFAIVCWPAARVLQQRRMAKS